MHRPWTLLTLLLTLSPMAMAQDEEFTFDAEEFEPKVFEFSGYIEGEPEYARANQDGALYQLQFFGRDPDKEIDRFTGTLELEGHCAKASPASISRPIPRPSGTTWERNRTIQCTRAI